MQILVDIMCLLLAIAIAVIAGKLISKLKLPAILGWLIAGMIMGPHALRLMGSSLLDAAWFNTVESLLECIVGLMIGTELIWSQMKKAGKQILVTTITESLGTFVVVSLVFGIIFWATGVPIYLAFLFGGIALATAPAPSLSVVNEFKTSGPVTKALIPMAALDDLVGALVFFLVVAFVSAHLSTAGIPVPVVLFLVFLPVLIGIVTGFITGKLLQHTKSRNSTLAVMLVMLLVSAGVGFFINSLLPTPVLNFMLIGMAFSTVFANMVTKEQLDGMMKVMNPVIGFSLVVAILNLAAPLDYHLIFGAGIYTAIYIIARAIGKYTGAYFGASITRAPDTVKKYLGFTLLPIPGFLWYSPALRFPFWRGRRRSAPPSSRERSRRRRSSMKSLRSTWPRRDLSGPENCTRRKEEMQHDAEGAAGAQQRGNLSGSHGRVRDPRL